MTKTIFAAVLLNLISPSAFAVTAWEAYLALPNSEKAAKVFAIEYSSGSLPSGWGYDARDLQVLSTQVISGDAEAFRLTYRLLQRTDGGLAEDLTQILASIIRPHPQSFLSEINQLNPSQTQLRFIINMTGEEYVDRFEARAYEISMREEAINSVQEPKLQKTKATCLKQFIP